MKVEPIPPLSPPALRGWFKAMRGDDAIEIIRTNPNAFLLAYVIAYRARWREGFNEHGLGQGEAFLGDFESYGMTQQNYRTAKAQLEKWKFATFRPTNKGTVGKLIDSRLFSTSIDDANEQCNELLTNRQRTANERVTTNEEGKKVKKEKKGNAAPCSSISRQEDWQLEKELKCVKADIKAERLKGQAQSVAVIKGMLGKKQSLEDEKRRRYSAQSAEQSKIEKQPTNTANGETLRRMTQEEQARLWKLAKASGGLKP